MLVTLVAVLCNGQLCLEKVVTNSDLSGISMTSCAVQGQIGIADWLVEVDSLAVSRFGRSHLAESIYVASGNIRSRLDCS